MVELPNGEVGRKEAYHVAVSSLKGLIYLMREELEMIPRSKSLSKLTPSLTPKSSSDMSARKLCVLGKETPKEDLKKYKNNLTGTPMGVPSLKKSVTPLRSHRKSLSFSKHSNKIASTNKYTPPSLEILTSILGMMQRLSTSKRLDKAEARERSKVAVNKFLEVFPAQQRLHFLYFILKLCKSKIAMHRLFGVELACDLLSMDSIWSDHFVEKSEKCLSNFDSDVIFDKMAINSESVIGKIFHCINLRFNDRVPAIRNRAASCFATALNNISNDPSTTLQPDSILNFKSALRAIQPNLHESLRKGSSSDKKASVRRAMVSAW
eukprot:CAMPEP_0184870862 /NCGR_PEP_ID=MMETSP0580-20130426/39064_1 /TAXON_ID=1118495 /ORGANISM="Dactyliosolen fragilissimus" /LENGTH=321 /DNA_ID=CAMNT_0027373205 /DNA_START=193 /DNA_END=1155 /DNA_ORIENTATION=+